MEKLLSLLSIIILLLFVSCGDGNQKPEKDSSPPINEEEEQNTNGNNGDEEGGYNNFVEGMKNLEQMMTKGEKYEAVDFRKLKDLLPEELDGMKRISATGEKTNSFGIRVSQTVGKYENEDGSSNIKLTITDLGSMQGFAGMAAFAWAFADVDKETESGYERTTTFSGNKAFEKYNTKRMQGSIEILVAKRFMVKSEGYNVAMDQIQSSAGLVNLGGLADMKEEGKKTD